MTIVVVVVLAVLWAWFLASWLKNHTAVRRTNSISDFSGHLRALGQAQPAVVRHLHAVGAEEIPVIRTSRITPAPRDPLVRTPAVYGLLGGSPITIADARRRRRDMLTLLAVVAMTTSIPFGLSGSLLGLAVAGWSLVATYGLLLFRAQRLTLAYQEKVTYLHPVLAGRAYYDEPAYQAR